MRIKFFEHNIIGEPCWQTASELSNKKYLAEIFSNFSLKKKYWNSGQCDRSRWIDITQQVYGLFSSSHNWKSVLANVNEKMQWHQKPILVKIWIYGETYSLSYRQSVRISRACPPAINAADFKNFTILTVKRMSNGHLACDNDKTRSCTTILHIQDS